MLEATRRTGCSTLEIRSGTGSRSFSPQIRRAPAEPLPGSFNSFELVRRERTVLCPPASGIAFENLELLFWFLGLPVDNCELVKVPRGDCPAIDACFAFSRLDQRQ